MALALSASLAHSKIAEALIAQKKELQELQELGILKLSPNRPPLTSGATSSNLPAAAKPSEVILPSANWPEALLKPPPLSAARPKKSVKISAKTQLEVRTSEERTRLVSERIATILTCGDAGVAGENRSSHFPVPSRQFLCDAVDGDRRLWEAASSAAGGGRFVTDIMDAYVHENKSGKGEPMKNLKSAAENKSDAVESDDVGPSWSALFESGEKSDVIIYCKGEREVRCHSLVLLVRCKKILGEMIVSENAKGESETVLTWSDVRMEAVVAFVGYLYCGKVGEVTSKAGIKDLKRLAMRYQGVGSCLQRQLGIVEEAFLLSGSDSEKEAGEDQLCNGFSRRSSEFHMEEQEDEPQSSPGRENLDYLLSALDDGVSQEEGNSDAGSEHVDEQDEEAVKVGDEPEDVDEEEAKHEDEAVIFIDSDEDMFSCDDDEDNPVIEAARADNKVLTVSLEGAEDMVAGNKSCEQEEELPSILSEAAISEVGGDLPSLPNSQNLFGGAEVNFDDDDVWDGFDADGGDVPLAEDHNRGPAIALKTPSPMPGPSRSVRLLSTQLPSAASSTPKTGRRLIYSQSDAVTPKPNYDNMLSPALRKELDKYGLKVIPRRKAVPLLDHIYEETHPIVEEENEDKVSPIRPRRQDSPPPMASSQTSITDSDESDSSSDGEEVPEESMMEEEEEVASVTASQVVAGQQSLSEAVMEYIRSDHLLYTQVLLYEPFWLEDFVTAFKERMPAIKCSVASVTDVLDSECVTFRTRGQSASSAVRRNRKKKSPKKRRARGSPKKKREAALKGSPKKRKYGGKTQDAL
jgi:hypothetical protein